jgi:four helix bundle protein
LSRRAKPSTITFTITSTATKILAQLRASGLSALRRLKVLSFQKLDVYKCAIEFLALVAVIVIKLPRGYSYFADELKRAAMSILQNIAEGMGKPTEAEKFRYLGISRGSAMECGAILDACSVLKLIDANISEKGFNLIERIVSMLTKMIKV